MSVIPITEDALLALFLEIAFQRKRAEDWKKAAEFATETLKYCSEQVKSFAENPHGL